MKSIIYTMALLLTAATAFGQISIGGTPFSFNKGFLKKNVPTEVMPALDMKSIQQEDEEDQLNGRPPRFGYPIDVTLTLDNSGVWKTLDNGDRLWRLTVFSPGAISINLLYDAFWLPTGAKLYIYNQDKTHVIGGFTAQNNNSPRGESIGYATGLVYGDQITIEYYEPKDVEEVGEISIAKVVHGYRLIDVTDEKAFADSDPCQINVNCAEGDDWQAEKTSVALILVNGSRWCTGSLLNNTTVDFTPYFLTADHCLDGWAIPTDLDAVNNPNGSTWTFYWNYESPDCANPATDPTNFQSTTGAILVANRQESDFALFRLTEDPYLDAGMGLLYNGWDTGNPDSGESAGIHHPAGDIKKISIEDDQVTSFGGTINWDGGSSTPPDSHWRVVFDEGGTEGGSSGSPLFDPNHRVIGQLHGGSGELCVDDRSFYGKFSTSWNAGNEARRLKDWLAPKCNLDLNITDDVTIGAPTYYASNTITSNASISGGVTYVVYNGGRDIVLSEGFEARSGANFIARNFDCSGGSSFQPIAEKSDQEILNAAHPDKEVSHPKPSDEKNTIANVFEISQAGKVLLAAPNPFKEATTISYTAPADGQVTIKVFNLTGQEVQTLQNGFQEAGEYRIPFRATGLNAGTYLCSMRTPAGTETVKLVLVD